MSDDHDHDRDKRKNNFLATTSRGAIASLESLGAALNKVDTRTAAGRSGLPMAQFKRDGSGTWLYGQKGTVIEEGSKWAANPLSFQWGYISFDSNNKVVGERLVPVTQPKPDLNDLPNTGSKWSEQWTVNLKCLDGSDAGVEVVYKPTTLGGIQAVASLIDAVRDRINSGQHDGNVVPILLLEKDSYQHAQYGKVWTPVLTIVGWMPLDGPPPAKAAVPAEDPLGPFQPPPPSPPAASAAEQPRRRRVA